MPEAYIKPPEWLGDDPRKDIRESAPLTGAGSTVPLKDTGVVNGVFEDGGPDVPLQFGAGITQNIKQDAFNFKKKQIKETVDKYKTQGYSEQEALTLTAGADYANTQDEEMPDKQFNPTSGFDTDPTMAGAITDMFEAEDKMKEAQGKFLNYRAQLKQRWENTVSKNVGTLSLMYADDKYMNWLAGMGLSPKAMMSLAGGREKYVRSYMDEMKQHFSSDLEWLDAAEDLKQMAEDDYKSKANLVNEQAKKLRENESVIIGKRYDEEAGTWELLYEDKNTGETWTSYVSQPGGLSREDLSIDSTIAIEMEGAYQQLADSYTDNKFVTSNNEIVRMLNEPIEKIEARIPLNRRECGMFAYDFKPGALPRRTGDTWESKQSLCNTNTPVAGAFFVQRNRGVWFTDANGKKQWSGHCGWVKSIDWDKQEAIVIDANNDGNHKIQEHSVPLKDITGYFDPRRNNNGLVLDITKDAIANAYYDFMGMADVDTRKEKSYRKALEERLGFYQDARIKLKAERDMISTKEERKEFDKRVAKIFEGSYEEDKQAFENFISEMKGIREYKDETKDGDEWEFFEDEKYGSTVTGKIYVKKDTKFSDNPEFKTIKIKGEKEEMSIKDDEMLIDGQAVFLGDIKEEQFDAMTEEQQNEYNEKVKRYNDSIG